MLVEAVRRHPLVAVCAALALVSGWALHSRGSAIDLAAQRKVQADQWRGKFRDQKAEMLKFVGTVRQARADAARLDALNVARVKGEWAANLSEVKNGYEVELGAARAAVARRMLGIGAGTAAGGYSSGLSAAELSALPALSTRALRAGGAAIVDGPDIDACTVNTVRTESLIDAWTRASAINVNAPDGGR